jgi:transposase-like protein
MAWIDQFNGVTSFEEFRRLLPDEDTARRLLEALVWPDGRFCPNCGGGETAEIKNKKKPRAGLYRCPSCLTQFTATTRTPLHATKLPIRIWLLAIYQTLMSSKGISSVVLGRQLGIKQASAWKVAQAIRLLMRPPAEEKLTGTVEVDTVAIGGDPKKRNIRRHGQAGKFIHNPRGKGSSNPSTMVTIERADERTGRPGRVRSAPMDGFSTEKISPLLNKMVDTEATLHSDDDTALKKAGEPFADHQTVVHSAKEFARGDVHANTVEGFNNTIRRAYVGVWHFWSDKHGQRYLDELAFRNEQRHMVRRTRVVRGKAKQRWVSEPLPVIEQMRALFANAVGRELRRTKKCGIIEVGAEPVARQAPAKPPKTVAEPLTWPEPDPFALDDSIPF